MKVRVVLHLAVLVAVSACGSSSDEESTGPLEDPVGIEEPIVTDPPLIDTEEESIATDPPPIDTGSPPVGTEDPDELNPPDGGMSDPNVSDAPDLTPVEPVDTGTTVPEPSPLEPPMARLVRASLSDTDELGRLAETIRSLATAGRFTLDNYERAIAAVATASRANHAFDRLEFLDVLERQILDDDTPLQFVNIAEGGFDRVHGCPDGGRLLARKAEPQAGPPTAGEYTFQACRIGDISVDGSYTQQTIVFRPGTDIEISALLRGLTIVGADGVSTSFQATLSQRVGLVESTAGDVTVNTVTNFSGNLDIESPELGVFPVFLGVRGEDVFEASEAGFDTVLPPSTRTLRVPRLSLFAQAGRNRGIAAATVAGLNFVQSSDSPNFETGQIELSFVVRSNRLAVQASNADIDTFDAFILEEDNSTVSQVLSWSDDAYRFGPTRRIPFFRPDNAP